MKVLIISHNPISKKNNMGKTFLSLFSEFDREELCQLYIYPAIPDIDRCASYFRVTDKDVVLSYLGKRRIGCQISRGLIHENQGAYENAGDETFYRSRKNKSALRRLLRDALWTCAPWYGKQLKAWLDREQPDCIFVAPGVAKFLYNIALRIAKDRNLPLVSYICDEYYFVREQKGLLEKLRLGLLRKKIRQLMHFSRRLVVISQELKEEYEQEFGVETSVLMTGASVDIAGEPMTVEVPGQICYFGNIRCNRYLVLAQVGRALDEINREQGTHYKLKIYTGEKDNGILSVFDGIDSVCLCGFVSGEEYRQAFSNAGLLLHVEAFDEASIDFTQHSVSTKIADSLASGIALVAYGPENISSMQHLLRNDCSIAVTREEDLKVALLRAFEEEAARKKAARNGLLTAKQFHDSRISSNELKKVMKQLLQ